MLKAIITNIVVLDGSLTAYVATEHVTFMLESQKCQIRPILPPKRKSKVKVKQSRYQNSRQMKAIRLSSPRTGHLYPPGNIPGTHFCQRLSQSQGHSAAGRIMSTRNLNAPSGIEPATFRLVAHRLPQTK